MQYARIAPMEAVLLEFDSELSHHRHITQRILY